MTFQKIQASEISTSSEATNRFGFSGLSTDDLNNMPSRSFEARQTVTINIPLTSIMIVFTWWAEQERPKGRAWLYFTFGPNGSVQPVVPAQARTQTFAEYEEEQLGRTTYHPTGVNTSKGVNIVPDVNVIPAALPAIVWAVLVATGFFFLYRAFDSIERSVSDVTSSPSLSFFVIALAIVLIVFALTNAKKLVPT